MSHVSSKRSSPHRAIDLIGASPKCYTQSVLQPIHFKHPPVAKSSDGPRDLVCMDFLSVGPAFKNNQGNKCCYDQQVCYTPLAHGDKLLMGNLQGKHKIADGGLFPASFTIFNKNKTSASL